MKRRVSQDSLYIVSLSPSCGVSPSRQISLNFLSPKSLPLPPGPFLSFFACVSISSCVSAHPPTPGPALPPLLTHSNMPSSEHVPSVPRDADRAQTPLSKGPFFSWLSPPPSHLAPNPLGHLLPPEGIYFAPWQVFPRVPSQLWFGICFGIAVALQYSPQRS